VTVLEEGEKILFSRQVKDNNSSLTYAFQVGENNIERQAITSLIASIVESDFYTQMRTNQQLGYIVFSFKQRIEDRLFMKFLIQSGEYGPFELKKRVDTWLSGLGTLFSNLTEEEFEHHRDALIVSLEKKGDSIAEVLSDLYYSVTEENEDFSYKQKVVDAVKKVTKEEVLATGFRILLDSQTPRLSVLIQSASNKDPVPSGVISEVDQFKNRTSLK
jgi:insulysin